MEKDWSLRLAEEYLESTTSHRLMSGNSKLHLYQVEAVFLVWSHSSSDAFRIWHPDMWVGIVALRNMWWRCRKVWRWKVILRSKISETLLTFALSVGISLAAMKLRLCITTIQEYFKYFCSRWWLVLFWCSQGMQDAAAHPWLYAEGPALPPVCQHTHTWNRALMPWSRGLCFDLDCLGGSL